MTESDITQLINSYQDRMKHDRKGKAALQRMLSDKEEVGFLYFLKDYGFDFDKAFKETVLHDVGGKTEALIRMKGFADHLRRNGIEFEVQWPPINDIGNRYERIVYMLRELQTLDKEKCGDERSAVRYLSERLWVSERTIEDDFSYIMPPYDRSAPRTIFQQSLSINGMTRSKGVVKFASTAHPFFLIENLSSVLVLMEALLEKAKTAPFKSQAMTTARRIWKQLTPYAQARITDLLKAYYPADSKELKYFSEMTDTIDREINAFLVEGTEHNDPKGCLLESMKLEIPCEVEYLINDWEYGKWTGIVKADSLGDDSLRIGEDWVLYDDIISAKLIER